MALDSLGLSSRAGMMGGIGRASYERERENHIDRLTDPIQHFPQIRASLYDDVMIMFIILTATLLAVFINTYVSHIMPHSADSVSDDCSTSPTFYILLYTKISFYFLLH